MSQDSRRRISEAQKEFWDVRGQHWTAAAVLAEIRRRHRAGRSLRCMKVSARLYEVGRLFGTWQKAIETAGVDYERVTGLWRWSREKVVEESRLSGAGVPLDATNIQRQHPALHQAAITQLPKSWAKALRAAGFDPDEHKQSRGVWNRQTAESWVRTRAARKKSIVARDVPRDLLAFVRRRLETGWAEFIEGVTGRPYPGDKKRWDWTEEKLLTEIRRLRAEKNPLTYRAVAACSQSYIHQARRFFGSWDAARAAAGA